MIYLACIVSAIVAFIAGWLAAPKKIVHPWPNEDRCTEILRGVRVGQCAYKIGHKGVHHTNIEGYDIPFEAGDRLKYGRD